MRSKRRDTLRRADVVAVDPNVAMRKARRVDLAVVDAPGLARRPRKRPPHGLPEYAEDEIQAEVDALRERIERIEGVLSRKDLL